MSDILASMSVVLGADISDFQRAMAVAKSELKGLVQFGEQLKSVGESMTKYLTLPIALAGVEAVRAFDKQAQAVAQVENGLRSTGNAAKLTSTQLQALASQIQKKSVYGDEDVLQKVTTQLLTFSNITGDTFKRTQQAAVDLSAKLGQDLQTSAIQLGKALNDPTQSLGALRRAGISFSADQIAVIHSLQATGQLGKAQTIILGELERQYGGTAEAAANAGTGGLKQLGNQLSDLLEGFGKIILDGMKPLITYLSNMVAAFEDLSPVMKKVIVVTLAVVAGLGPLLLVVGAIIAALPLLAAAFAVITGPIALIVAGVAALSIGLIAVISGSRNATAEFKEQKTAVDGLQKSVTPLLDRYDQLKAKSNLTKAEQEELRKIIEQVGGQIPTTITAFDAYGKALDINSDAARNFVKAQQEILSVKNLPALTKQRAEYKRLTEEIGFTSAALRNLDKDGSIVKQSSGLVKRGEDYESVINTVKLTGKEIAALQAKLSDLSTARRGVGGLIDELKGITPPLQKGGDAADSTAGKIDKSAKKMAEALAALNKSLKDNATYFKVSGNEGEFFADKIGILQSGIRNLVAAGFAPASQAIKDFLKQLRNTPGEIEQLNSIQAKYKAIPKQALPSKLDTIKTDGKSALEPIYDTETDAAVEFGGKLKDILTSGMADAAKVLAEGLGNVLSGTQSAGDALKSVFSGLIGIVGTFISKLGELLIAQATASLAFAALAAVGPLAAPAALAAGIAAIAIGSAVSSLSKSGPYAGGGGATASVSAPRGGSSFAPAGSAGSAQSPLTIRVEVVGTLRGAGKDLVAVLTAADYRRLRTA